MARISNSLLEKVVRFTSRISFLLLLSSSLLIQRVNAAPTISPRTGTSPKLVFWFQHDGNHQHEYSSHSDIFCDPLPEQISKNWASLTVYMEKGGQESNDISGAERCAILFHHGNCIDPVLALDLATPQSSLPREITSFRYCHSSCEKCTSGNDVPAGPLPSSGQPDYETMNK